MHNSCDTYIDIYLQRIWVPRYLAFDRGHGAYITYREVLHYIGDDPDHLQLN